MNLIEKLIEPIKKKSKKNKTGDRWTCLSCGQTNAMHRLACNYCGKDKEHT
ncbi:MAG: hypothetical protein FWE74_07220 [Oscillospiraceae bacterium]|nr:hypothetical protein [Oscillospiraceae bacterium]